MKIVNKLYLITAVAMILVVSAYGWFSYQSEAAQIETDMKLDAKILGNALSPILSEIWKTSGRDKVTEYIADANRHESLIHIRLVHHSKAESEFTPHVPQEELTRQRKSGLQTLWATGPDQHQYLYTYIPLTAPDGDIWKLELSESKEKIEKYTKGSMSKLILMAFILQLAAGLAIGSIGHWVVGKRMQKLVDYVHKIGKGNLSGTFESEGNDEITLLGTEMNAMCDNLFKTRMNLIKENKARFEVLEQLRHSDRLATVGQLSSGMAHELGTPLNVVAGRARSIADGRLDSETAVKYAGIIEEQAKRMTEIISQLLDFARRREPNKSEARLENLIREAVEILKPIGRKQNVSVSLQETEIDSSVSIDYTQIQQVFVNVIMNGIQSMPDGGTLEITMHKTTREPNTQSGPGKTFIAVTVRDNGTGISEENLPKVFDPFFTTKDIGKGTGLGLSIAYGIMKDHEGWIDVSSTVDEGSIFTLYFPVST